MLISADMPSLEDFEDDLEDLLLEAPTGSGVCSRVCSGLLREVAEVVTHTIGDHRLAPPSVSLLLVGSHPAAVSYASSTEAAAFHMYKKRNGSCVAVARPQP